MARPKRAMTPEESAALIASAMAKADHPPATPEEKERAKVVVLRFQMGLPCDLLGSKVSFAQSRTTSLEATPLGIIMRSKESKRKMLVTWANVKAAEFAWDGE